MITNNNEQNNYLTSIGKEKLSIGKNYKNDLMKILYKDSELQ